MAPRVLIVDDFKPFRQFLVSHLKQRYEFRIFEASNGLEAIEKIDQFQPDLILLDLSLPGLHGIEVCKCARKLVPAAKILFLSQEFSTEIVEEALCSGARAYVHKIHAARDLSFALDAVLNGERFVSGGWSDFASIEERELSQRAAQDTWHYAWQQTVMDAVKAPPRLLPAKINLGERAIAARLLEPYQLSEDEHRAVKEALRTLRVLIRETEPQPQSVNARENIA